MRLITLLTIAGTAVAWNNGKPPPGESPAVTDEIILQYALTLEHLESAFYSGALARFNASDFAAGGEQHALFTQIAGHEAAHVQLLQSVLGSKATKACNYSFPYNDVQGFKALAQVLEGVGVTAYLGAAQYINNKAYLTAAGAILTVESRHAAWLATTNGDAPWPGPYDTPLGFSQVYSLAAPFITSCPSTNPKLPVKAFPALTAANATGLMASDRVQFTVGSDVPSGDYYIAFLNGLTPVFLPYKVNETVTIPDLKATGTVYAVITKNNQSASDDTTVAGPAILMFDPGFPAGVVDGSSTGMGSGLPGTDGNGNNATSAAANANAPGTSTAGAASRGVVASWSAAIFGLAAAFAALL